MSVDILPVQAPTGVPATGMQEALWWAHQRARNRSVYNLTWRLACDRAVDFDALGTAWQAVVDRHDAMRTALVSRDGRLELDLVEHVTVVPQRIEVDEADSPDTLLRLIAEEVHEQVFDLATAPLVKLTLVRVGDQHELLMTVHHSVLDGWAVQLLIGELSIAYAAARAGTVPVFETEPVPFTVYAREQADAKAAGTWAKGVEHWSGLLNGAVSSTVAADRHRAAGTGAPGETVRYSFSDEAAAGIALLAKTTYATPFAVVLAALQIVLARGGETEDVSIGIVVANRMTQRDQQLVGYTANMCYARAIVGEGDTITEVTGRARDGMWAMLAHQGVPYPEVFAALDERTQTNLSDTAPVMLNYLGPIGNGLSMGDVGLWLHRSPNRAARSDIAIAFWDVEGGHVAETEYNTGRYDLDTVLTLLQDVDAVLAAANADPATPVASLVVESRAALGLADHHVPSEVAPSTLPSSGPWDSAGALWTDLLGERPAGPDVDFFTAGGRSLKAVQLAAAAEARTGVPLDLVRWLGNPTPRTLAELLGEDAPTGPVTTVLTLREGTGPHLHLVHGSGGTPQDYRDLVAALPADWRVTVSQEREPLDSVRALASRYRADLDAADLRPDVLGGWSLGGQIAYELAVGYGVDAPPLVLLDSAPPVGYDQAVDFSAFAATVCGSLGAEQTWSTPVVSGTNPEIEVRALAACLGAAGHDAPADVLAQRWETFRRHATAVAGYVSDTVVPVRALVVGAILLDVQLDQWALRVDVATTLRVDADHVGVLHGEHLTEVAAAIEDLGRART